MPAPLALVEHPYPLTRGGGLFLLFLGLGFLLTAISAANP